MKIILMINLLFMTMLFYISGIVGNGKQFMSWIHISDMTGIILHALENHSVHGVINATAPNPVTNSEFTSAFARSMWRPAFFPLPAFVVNTVFGEERGKMLLEGQKVLPSRTIESGYNFLYSDIKSCLQNIVK